MRITAIAAVSLIMALGLSWLVTPLLQPAEFNHAMALRTVAKIDDIRSRAVLDSNDVPTGRYTRFADLTYQDNQGEKASVSVTVTDAFHAQYAPGDALTISYDASDLNQVDFPGKAAPPTAFQLAFILSIVLAMVIFLALLFLLPGRAKADDHSA